MNHIDKTKFCNVRGMIDYLGSQTWVLFRNAWELFVDFAMQAVLYKYSNLNAGRLGQGVYFLTAL